MQFGVDSVMSPGSTFRQGYEQALDPLIEEKEEKLR